MRLRLDIAYDGADFHGWAAQQGLRTVQGDLQLWIARVLRLGEEPTLVCAGRTDAGVHARGQVAHVDLPDEGTQPGAVADLLERRLLRALPADVVVRRVAVAPEGFDARFSAIWRRYVYRLTDRPLDPLTRRTVVAVPQPLDLGLLGQAAGGLLGLHDFAAFCKAREGATTVRHLQSLAAIRGSGGVVEITVTADAFCHSMVRSVVGALVAVSTGRRDLPWIGTLVDAPARVGSITVMPARGLVLEEVGDPEPDQLAARVSEARARRRLDPEGDG